MNSHSILQHVTEMQPETGQVFCPMCEVIHDNNTWCQAYYNSDSFDSGVSSYE